MFGFETLSAAAGRLFWETDEAKAQKKKFAERKKK
jgi:1,4-dihydroxy-2-naphthoyl-CoA synthase